jgi:hypothetical protein
MTMWPDYGYGWQYYRLVVTTSSSTTPLPKTAGTPLGNPQDFQEWEQEFKEDDGDGNA